MIKVEGVNIPVVDSVAHGYDLSDANRSPSCLRGDYDAMVEYIYTHSHCLLESQSKRLSKANFIKKWEAEDLHRLYFEESSVDYLIYHHVEISHYFKHGASTWETGKKLRAIEPERVKLFFGVDTFSNVQSRVFDDMTRAVDEGAVGFKFYPSNGLFDRNAGKLISLMYDDPEVAYRYFDHANSLGIKHLAFHKAQPVGPGPRTAVNVEDVSTAALMFPETVFEVVHSGWAFLEDCAFQLRLHKNIYANLENVVNLLVNYPRRFAEILGTLLFWGGDDRILFATGCALTHPEPVLQAFANFKMPRDLVEEYGYPEVSVETKRKILFENSAKLHDFRPLC